MTDGAPLPRGRVAMFARRLLLFLWVPTVLVVCAYLLGGHLLTLPKPAMGDPRLTQGMLTSRAPASTGQWFTVHILYDRCRCSKRVLDHLLSRHAGPLGVERIVMIDAPDGTKGQVEAAGFEFEALTSAQIEDRYGVVAAPLMLVSDPANVVRYVGGYTAEKQSAFILDQRILGELAAGGTPKALPMFGCAVSEKLRSSVDPLGLRQ